MAYIGSKPNDTRQLARREFSYAVTVASTTTFTGSDAGGKTLSYQPGELEVYMNGVRLDPADYTATTGSSVVLGSGANIGDNINIFAGQILPTDDYVSKTSGGTFDGNLLVGGTTYSQNSSEKLSVFGRTGIEANGSVVLGLDRQTSDGEILQFRKDNGTIGSIGTIANYMTVGTSDSGILFHSGEDNIQPWNVSTNAGRDNAINIGASNARFKDAYLSGGVYLGGTGAANKLDDYEEGTWTPTMTGATFSTNYTCRYTKIGNLVNLDLAVEMNAIGNTHLQISGLPFTSIAGVWGGDIWTNGWSSEPGHVRYWSGSTSIAFYQSNGSGGINAINQSMIGGSGGNIFGTITYMTNS
jgi:hypothetical protein